MLHITDRHILTILVAPYATKNWGIALPQHTSHHFTLGTHQAHSKVSSERYCMNMKSATWATSMQGETQMNFTSWKSLGPNFFLGGIWALYLHNCSTIDREPSTTFLLTQDTNDTGDYFYLPPISIHGLRGSLTSSHLNMSPPMTSYHRMRSADQLGYSQPLLTHCE